MNWAEKLGHYAVGAAAGIALATLIAFGSGWIIMSRSVDKHVERAQVEAFAAVCVDWSLASWKEDGKATRDLQGNTNIARDELIERFIPEMGVAIHLKDKIRNACANIIRFQA